MSSDKNKTPDGFDLRAALAAQSEEAEQQQQSYERYRKIQEKEFPRLAAEAYKLIRERLNGIKGITVESAREKALPYESLVIRAGKTITFSPVDYTQFMTGSRGTIEIMDGYKKSNYSIEMTGGQEGNWELAIAELFPHRARTTEKLTVQSLDLLLGKLLGVTA